MHDINELDDYFRDLEAQNKFSGVGLITQGEATLYAGAYGYSRAGLERHHIDKTPELSQAQMQHEKDLSELALRWNNAIKLSTSAPTPSPFSVSTCPKRWRTLTR